VWPLCVKLTLVCQALLDLGQGANSQGPYFTKQSMLRHRGGTPPTHAYNAKYAWLASSLDVSTQAGTDAQPQEPLQLQAALQSSRGKTMLCNPTRRRQTAAAAAAAANTVLFPTKANMAAGAPRAYMT
jgi:hypothetical protein